MAEYRRLLAALPAVNRATLKALINHLFRCGAAPLWGLPWGLGGGVVPKDVNQRVLGGRGVPKAINQRVLGGCGVPKPI